jgi:hypothetical protein
MLPVLPCWPVLWLLLPALLVLVVPAEPLPEPVLSTETWALTDPGRFTEASDRKNNFPDRDLFYGI